MCVNPTHGLTGGVGKHIFECAGPIVLLKSVFPNDSKETVTSNSGKLTSTLAQPKKMIFRLVLTKACNCTVIQFERVYR